MAMAYELKTRKTTSTTQLGKLVDDMPIVPITAAYLTMVLPDAELRRRHGFVLPIGIYLLMREDRKPKGKQAIYISTKGLLNDLALWGVVWFTLMSGTENLSDSLKSTSFDQAHGRQA
jgi:hypothetical protein